MTALRGQVWWAHRWPKRRPVIVLTRSTAAVVRAMVTVCPLTRTIRGLETEVLLGPQEGLPVRCAANTDDLVTIPKRDLETFICDLSPAKMAELSARIHFALALECPRRDRPN